MKTNLTNSYQSRTGHTVHVSEAPGPLRRARVQVGPYDFFVRPREEARVPDLGLSFALEGRTVVMQSRTGGHERLELPPLELGAQATRACHGFAQALEAASR